jgi:preprotein translocase subunit SecA
MRVFASDMLKKVMGTFKIPEDEPIASGMISKSLETAQKRIEGFNFDARKQVLAYDDVMNTQRLSIYDRRRIALTGTAEEIEAAIQEMIAGDEAAIQAYEAKKQEYGAEMWIGLMRRLILQMTDAFWLEQLETMDYLRRTVSLRAYGQRDPLIEYRREGLQRFQDMEAGIAQQIREAMPHVMPADDSRIRAQEEKTRRALVAASEGGDGTSNAEKAPIVKGNEPGRNDTVTIRKGEETQTLKYKKAESLLAEGWVLES